MLLYFAEEEEGITNIPMGNVHETQFFAIQFTYLMILFAAFEPKTAISAIYYFPLKILLGVIMLNFLTALIRDVFVAGRGSQIPDLYRTYAHWIDNYTGTFLCRGKSVFAQKKKRYLLFAFDATKKA